MFWRGNAYIGFAFGGHSALTKNRPSFPLDSFFGALKKLEIKMQHGDFFSFLPAHIIANSDLFQRTNKVGDL